MSMLAKIRVAALSAVVVLVPSLAHAVAGPDNSVSSYLDGYFPFSRSRIFLTRPGFSGLWGSAQGPGCNGSGNPVPVYPLPRRKGFITGFNDPAFESWFRSLTGESPSIKAGDLFEFGLDNPGGGSATGGQRAQPDVGWQLMDSLKLRGSWGRAFSSPDVYQTFGTSQDALSAWSWANSYQRAALDRLWAISEQRADSTSGSSATPGSNSQWWALDNWDVGRNFYGTGNGQQNRGFGPKGSGRSNGRTPNLSVDSIFWDIYFESNKAPSLYESRDSSKNGLSNYQPAASQFMLFPDLGSAGLFDWPSGAGGFSDFGASYDPYKGRFGADGSVNLGPSLQHLFGSGLNAAEQQLLQYYLGNGIFGLPVSNYGSVNLEAVANALNPVLQPFVTQQLEIGDHQYTTLFFDSNKFQGLIDGSLQVTVVTTFENNHCRVVQVPTDPNYLRTGRHAGGSWGQRMDDQWAIKRVGFTDDENSAWNLMPESAAPVVVAVIDTGLDWHHLDIDHNSIWRNEDEIPDNGVDDDRNGYVDDVIGWDFIGRQNKPWDFDGHGTVVTGIIAAAQNNDAGIAGINPAAKIMVLKAVSNFGTTRASYLAEAIVYAADNGARVINLSVGGPHTSRMEQAAINYAHDKGVLIVAASGNEGVELDDFGPGGGDHVLTVGATHVDDRAAAFSNFGDRVDMVAPGVDVLSLRARYTDANYRPISNTEYEIGTNYVGEDKRYLHVSGTSFSAPIVTATASMIIAKNPELTAAQVEHILLQTAEDIEFPGKDKYSGHGMVDARTALQVDPDFFVEAKIDSVQRIQSKDDDFYEIKGTANAQVFKRAWLQIGYGENPDAWKYVGVKIKQPIIGDTLSTVKATEFNAEGLWNVVVNVEHKNGTVHSGVYPLTIE